MQQRFSKESETSTCPVLPYLVRRTEDENALKNTSFKYEKKMNEISSKVSLATILNVEVEQIVYFTKKNSFTVFLRQMNMCKNYNYLTIFYA